jgi:DNA-binding IclR family transcriptional regulator
VAEPSGLGAPGARGGEALIDRAATPLSVREPVAQRILLALEACASKQRALTLGELVDETGLAKTTVHRICWKLVELGLLERTDEGFAVGVKLFALANSNPVINKVRVAAVPLLLDLQRSTGTMSNLAILHDGKALILDALYMPQPVIPRLVGATLPLHCTAIGKAIAANLESAQREELLGHARLPAATGRSIVRHSVLRQHLDRVAQEGVAFSDEEFMLGVSGVAASIVAPGGATIAIGCVGPWNSAAIRSGSNRVARAAEALHAALL